MCRDKRKRIYERTISENICEWEIRIGRRIAWTGRNILNFEITKHVTIDSSYKWLLQSLYNQIILI